MKRNVKSSPHPCPLLLLLLLLLLLFFACRLTYSPEPPSASLLPPLPRLAYFISGSKGDGPRLHRLLRAAYHPRNHYLLHLDPEASDAERLELAALRLPNVMVVGRPNVVTPKGPTELAATLHSAAILLKKAPQWDWFINLGASDYPLISQHDLLHLLSFLPRDLNFIHHTSDIGQKENERTRPIIIDSGLYHSKKSAIFWVKERRSMPASFNLFMGSPWVMLSKSLVELCVWGWDNLPRTLLLYHANVLSSSETYFHTVACNHKEFQNTTVNHHLRFLLPPPSASVSVSVSLDDMLLTGAPFAHNIPPHHPVLDAIDARLLPLTPSFSHPDLVLPTSHSNSFQKLLLNLLHPQNLRAHQCK